VNGTDAAVGGVEQQDDRFHRQPLRANLQRNGDREVHPVVGAHAMERHAPSQPRDSRRPMVLNLSNRPVCPICVLLRHP
jgi:hypothetical protein